MPKQINVPGPGRALVRMFSLKGRFQPVLDETIVPVVIVPNEAPTTKQLAAWGIELGASGAGNQNNFFFANPASSGKLVVLTHFWAINTGALTDHFHVQHEVAAALTTTGEWRDDRLTGTPRAIMQLSAIGSSVAIGPRFIADGTIYAQEFVLPPGRQLRFRQDAINAALSFEVFWYEVPLTAESLVLP